MKIGIISDTHNNIDMTKKAMDVFNKHEVELIIHAGDLTSPKILNTLVGIPCKFVLGNADIDIEILNDMANELGIDKPEKYCDLRIGDKRILVLHGDDVRIFRDAVLSGRYNYIIKGHTHHFENYVSNNTRVINPGSLFRGDDITVAILNTESDSVEKINILTF